MNAAKIPANAANEALGESDAMQLCLELQRPQRRLLPARPELVSNHRPAFEEAPPLRADRHMALTPTQIGILKDIQANRITLDDAGEWLRDQLAEIVSLDGPMLIDTQGPSVFLTSEGDAALASLAQSRGHHDTAKSLPTLR